MAFDSTTHFFIFVFYLFFRCENCKLLAPTLKQIEDEYGKDVNFVMINGDQDSAWPMIEAFGVDAIPHLALVEADGTVDTALIGPVPKQWLERDLQVLKDNAKTLEGSNKVAVVAGSETEPVSSTTSASLQPLPYQMLDAFANRPNERRVVVQKVVQ
jgi:thioredoxin-like negative regulator of GroEL